MPQSRFLTVVYTLWLHARVSHQHYLYDGYLSDLNIAWQNAEREAKQQILQGQASRAIADCARYLLIWSSIGSLTARYAFELIVHAIRLRLWEPHRAFSRIAKSPSPDFLRMMYVEAFLEVLKAEKSDEVPGTEAFNSHRVVPPILEDERSRAWVLTELAPKISAELRRRALEASLALKDEGSCA